MNLTKLSKEVGEWAVKNFGPDREMEYVALLGMVEELGELSHAHIKELQGIRGSKEEHQQLAQDAIGDLMIYLLHYCYARGFDLDFILMVTWASVSKRDWKRFPKDGVKG